MLCTNNEGLLLGEPLAQRGPSAVSRVELADGAETLLKPLGAAALTLLCKSSGIAQVPAWHWALTHCLLPSPCSRRCSAGASPCCCSGCAFPSLCTDLGHAPELPLEGGI